MDVPENWHRMSPDEKIKFLDKHIKEEEDVI